MASSEHPGARAAGLLAVLAFHGAALYGLMRLQIVTLPDEVATLFVEVLPPAPAPERARPLKLEKPRPAAPQAPRTLVAEAAASAPDVPAAPPPPPAAPSEAPPPRPAGPLLLEGELAVSCPERTPPAYPPASRRLGEEGKVVLRVELDEQGVVGAALVASGSGHARLDQAALAAVKTWRCTPARRDGRPVRAVALQPFRFVLQ